MFDFFKRKMSGQKVVGIDINAEGIAVAIKTNQHKDKQASLDCDYVAIKDHYKVSKALEFLVDKHDLKGMQAVMLMQANKYSLLQTSGPPMRQAQLRAAARWKINELIDYPAEEAVIDVFEYPDAGQRSADRMLYVVAARALDVRENIEWLRDVDLKLSAIDINELALRNVVSHMDENELGVVVLSLSEHSGMLVFLKDSEVYLSRRLDIGFEDLLNQDRQLGDEIVLELQRSLDYFESQFTQRLPAKLLIYPQEKLTSDILGYLDSHLNLQVEPLMLEKMSGHILRCNEDSQSRCLWAVGAALREFTEAKV